MNKCQSMLQVSYFLNIVIQELCELTHAPQQVVNTFFQLVFLCTAYDVLLWGSPWLLVIFLCFVY